MLSDLSACTQWIKAFVKSLSFLRLTTDRLSPETSSLGEDAFSLSQLFLKLILLLAQALMLISKEKLDLFQDCRMYSGDPWMRVPLGNRRRGGKHKTLI